MAGQLAVSTEHNFPTCTANALSLSPPTHTQTIPLTFTSLPDGDSAAKIRRTPPIKDNSNVITDKAAHRLHEGKIHTFSFRRRRGWERVTLKDKDGGWLKKGGYK